MGSGQIRTNQFDSSPWTLREFKLATDSGSLKVVPFPTAESPNGLLWDENSSLPQGEACRENFLEALDGLLTDDPSAMSFIVDNECKNSESRNDFFTEDYGLHLQNSPNFRDALLERLQGTGLNPEDIASRARFAGSCIGCHIEANGFFLGNGVFAPFSNGFVHVQEFPIECENETGQCFQVSPALRDTFFPSRLQVMGNLLGVPILPNPCSGTFGALAAEASAKNVPDDIDSAEPAPVVELELPSADTPVGELQEEDTEIREAYGETTLSGKSAQSTH